MSFLSVAFMLDKYQRPRLTMEEVGEQLGIAENTVYNRIAKGDLGIVTYRDAGKRWADIRDVVQYLDDLREKAHADREKGLGG